MKKSLLSLLIGIALSGCTLIHKNSVEQGNVIEPAEVSKLHRGMSESAVKAVMGEPVFVNIFAANRMDYVYTFKKGYEPMTEKRVTCTFVGGRLRDIEQTNS